MKRFSGLNLVLFLLCVLPLTALTVNAQLPACSQLKVTTLPNDYGRLGKLAVTRQAIQHPDEGVPDKVSVFVPESATPGNRRPVVFFAHGFGGTDYRFYEDLLRQLSSNGYIVVFAPYTASFFTTNAARYQQIWSGFQLAVQQYGGLMDTSKVGFAGHSYGAGAVPEMTKRGVERGWGGGGLFMFAMAPWFSWGTDYSRIPANAKLVVQVYWDDATNEHLIGQNDVWNRLPQITERKWQVIRRASAFCSLEANHRLPVTGVVGGTGGDVNAFDYWGVWRRLHALSEYTFNNNANAKNVAFGIDAQMGRWRMAALRPVTPLQATDAPVVNSQSNPTFRWANRCAFADAGVPCN
ncbi:MAG TPA: hypothetical protein VNI84_14775 [Pyrinomonadaceae bacterium]|nr:hypothetical protein [Pyrinomonadaceae bacterium]